MAKTFHCAVVTPERVVLELEATFVALPAHDGELGILRGRAPLVCKLDVGALRAKSEESTEILYVDCGFAEMVDNRLTVLTEVACRPDELNREQALEALEAARGMTMPNDAAFAARQRALRRARVQLHLGSS